MKMKVPVFLSLVVLLVFSLIVPAAAQSPAPDAAAPGPHAEPRFDPASGLRQDENGLWRRAGDMAEASAAGAEPTASGGPDDFGYTWADTALNWIGAGGGADTGITANNSGAGPFDIGFPFKFYENTRSQVYVSRYGYLAFSGDNLWNSQSVIPSAEMPNDVIAPHWVPNYDGLNYVRYLRGGTAPNRWFTVEWNGIRSYGNVYTFEAVLYESGNIVFQYGAMTTIPGYCQSSGIEDSTGLDGLAITPFCADIAANHAVRITRPGAAARVNLFPRSQGLFGAPAGTVSFNQTVRNTGELGVDTYDLYSESVWPVTLYHADGISPLADTDGDGQLDTGPVDQGNSKTIVVKMQIPADATVGASGMAQVTAISSRNPTKQKTARFQTAVPAPFAASYSQSGQTSLGYYRPGAQNTRRTAADNSYAYNAAAATMPDGRVVQVWQQGRNLPNNGPWVNELHYAMTDNKGNVLRSAAKITDFSGVSWNAYDSAPSVAVSPDGRIGVAWYRSRYRNGNDEYNYDIQFLVLDANGDMVVPPTSVTRNDIWFKWSGSYRFEVYDPVIAVTPDSRFGIAWQRYTSDGSNGETSVWYAVRRADGSEARGPTQFGDGTRSGDPNLTSLADGTLFLSLQNIGNLGYGRIDSAGNIVTPLVTVLGPTVYPSPDATQLPNGNIIVAWANNPVQYLVLNSALQVVKSISSLPAMSPVGDYNVSVTASGNRAALTWGDACCDYMPNLYYALLDDGGNVITPPMIFFSDYNNYSVRLPYNGQGNTPLIGDKPPQSRTYSPAFVVGAVPVTWGQTGGDATVTKYDIWARRGANGTWTKWLAGTQNTSAVYTGATAGETVYFRSIATDVNFNVETDAPANGDSSTTIAAKEITGRVANLRGEPIFNASVNATSALNSARTDGRGDYHLYFAAGSGVTTLTVGRAGFGSLERRGIELAATDAPVDFVLPPAQDLIVNGGFEAGNLSGWQLAQSDGAPVVVAAAARAGGYGLRFGDHAGKVGADASAPAAVLSQTISQTVTIPATAHAPTLSLYFKTPAGNPDSQLEVRVDDGLAPKTYLAELSYPNDWVPARLNLDEMAGRTVTVTIRVASVSTGYALLLDEVSLGEATPGSYPVFLPVMRR